MKHNKEQLQNIDKNELIGMILQMEQDLIKLKDKIEDPKFAGEKIAQRPKREPFHAGIECIGDFDILNAEGIDLSEGGICFELAGALPFEMRFETGENDEKETEEHRAHLVWIRELDEGRFRLGFRFVPRIEDPLIVKVNPEHG